MEYNRDLIPLLEHIDPAKLTYQEWVSVGMALKHEGYTASVWEEWSKPDSRHKPGECYQKWTTFLEEAGSIVTGGTIYEYARQQGWTPNTGGHELDFDDVIQKDKLAIVDTNWIEGQDIQEPTTWNPVNELITYLGLFEASENVGYVTSCYQDEKGKFLPKKGNYDRTAGELIQALTKCNGDISNVFGTINEEAGAWIRFNPLDGNGVKNINVTDYRYALVESDSMEIEKQNAILRELELPIAMLVFSGSKSLHAIVKVEAASYEEYRKRVDYLYSVCEKNGLKIDTQNRNPSRLSRMPGVVRNGKKQFIVDQNIGKNNWNEWEEWIEGINDDLPDPEPLVDVWDNLPDLAPSLIEGVLRQGHKMLLAGPSKAGKSFALIELCIAIAEGDKWFDWQCAKGRVLYVNLELDRASCLHRFKDVYKALKIKAKNIKNIDIWNLRGKSVPMDKLAPKLIRRAQKRNYIAVVIDPIYKVITGDENSADQMAHFTNQFDKICTELGSAVIYCHHHSKGYQGSKRSMDRASGSGVFARDPDALLDLTELDLSPAVISQEKNRVKARLIADEIKKIDPGYYEEYIGLDDVLSEIQMKNHLKEAVNSKQQSRILELAEEKDREVDIKTAWRIEGTLREYATFEPLNLWFEYPIHHVDDTGILTDAIPEFEKAPWQRGVDSRKSKKQNKEERMNALEIAYSGFEIEGKEVTTNDLAEAMGVSNRTVYNRIREHGGFKTEKPGDGGPSIVTRKINKKG